MLKIIWINNGVVTKNLFMAVELSSKQKLNQHNLSFVNRTQDKGTYIILNWSFIPQVPKILFLLTYWAILMHEFFFHQIPSYDFSFWAIFINRDHFFKKKNHSSELSGFNSDVTSETRNENLTFERNTFLLEEVIKEKKTFLKN